MIRNILILGVVFLVTFLMYKGTRYASRLASVWFWGIFIAALIIYSILLWRQASPWFISDTIVTIVAIMVSETESE